MSLQTVDFGYVPSKPRKPRSLFQFLTWKGGLRPCGELRVILGGSHGWMIRKSGMALDHALEACLEEGFLQDNPERDAAPSINDLLELIDAEARGHKQYRIHEATDALAWDAAREEEARGLASPGHTASDQEAREDTRRPTQRQRKPSMDSEMRRVAVEMAQAGLATISELAELAGVSRQLVRYWLLTAGVDVAKVRAVALAKEWRKRLK